MLSSRDPTVRLRRAVQEDNLPLVKRLVGRYDMRNTDKNMHTSLSWSAICGNEDMFEWLVVVAGHDDDELSRDSENNTLIHLLASLPSQLYTPPSRAHVFQHGAAIRMASIYYDRFSFVLDWANVGGKTGLHVAAQEGNEGFVKLLVDLGADFDLPDIFGNTPLHYASAWGHLDVVRLLISSGCQFAARNNDGFTASDFSYSAQLQKIIYELVRTQVTNKRLNRRNPQFPYGENVPERSNSVPSITPTFSTFPPPDSFRRTESETETEEEEQKQEREEGVEEEDEERGRQGDREVGAVIGFEGFQLGPPPTSQLGQFQSVFVPSLPSSSSRPSLSYLKIPNSNTNIDGKENDGSSSPPSPLTKRQPSTPPFIGTPSESAYATPISENPTSLPPTPSRSTYFPTSTSTILPLGGEGTTMQSLQPSRPPHSIPPSPTPPRVFKSSRLINESSTDSVPVSPIPLDNRTQKSPIGRSDVISSMSPPPAPEPVLTPSLPASSSSSSSFVVSSRPFGHQTHPHQDPPLTKRNSMTHLFKIGGHQSVPIQARAGPGSTSSRVSSSDGMSVGTSAGGGPSGKTTKRTRGSEDKGKEKEKDKDKEGGRWGSVGFGKSKTNGGSNTLVPPANMTRKGLWKPKG
ncbi:FOG: Ankyrin repeat [Phaffia rhodozyma]|uniref:FOG: Ankyrin repeat n=1 Tax=Phaffia rhodozyma TaxID=264483 RepID=A0A0F7SI06_PHARH|nr:FOG: Ankyrin repeat [Phaffia rhodozyma]